MPRKALINGLSPCYTGQPCCQRAFFFSITALFEGAGGWAPFVNAPWNKSGPLRCYASTVWMLPVIIPHMKHASSLATAVTALLCTFLLRNTSVKYLFLNLSFALSAYAMTSAVSPSCRFLRAIDFLLLALENDCEHSTNNFRMNRLPCLVIPSLF